MSNYKVGEVAATFPKSVASKSESGKKLQSLFKEFYGQNKCKEGDKSNQVVNKTQKNKKFNDPNGESINERLNKSGKDKKRKFSNLNSSDVIGENDITQPKKKKITNLHIDFENLQTVTGKITKNEAGTTNSSTSEEKCFPRNKKQKHDFVKKPISFLNSSLKKKQTSISEKAEGEEKASKAYDFSSAKFKFTPFKVVNKNKNNVQDNIFNESSNKNFENGSKDYKKSKRDSNFSKKNFQNLHSVPDMSKKGKEIKEQEVINLGDSDGSDNAEEECVIYVKDDKKLKKDSNLSKKKFQNLDNVPGKGKKKKEIKKQEVLNVDESVGLNNAKEECETYVKNKKSSKKKFQNIDDQAFNSMNSPQKDKSVDQNKAQSGSNLSDKEGFENNVETHKGKKNKKLLKKKNKKKSKEVGNNDKNMEFQNESTASDSENESESLNKLDEKKVKNTSRPINMLNRKDSENFISLSSNDEPAENRTVAVGNLPISSSRKILQKLFAPFGPIENVRLRGAIPAKPNMPMKVAEITESFHSSMCNLRGFVTFKEKSSAMESLILNGTVVNGRHIFVDLAGAPGEKKAYDDKRSIFVGNLPFDVEEETIWSTFSQCGLIERIRVVRDRGTGASKGIAYVMFHKVEAKEKALTLENVEIGNRILRVKPVESSNHEKEEKGHNSKSPLNTFKSKAIRMKKNLKRPNSRKTVKKMEKKIKNLHKKKKIASQFKNMI